MEDRDIVQKGDLGALDFIAEGGQGKVYRATELRLPDCPGGLAYKEYKPGQVTAAGLEAIVSVRSRLSEGDRQKLDRFAAWPARLVKDRGQMTGILMPLIPDEFVHQGVSPRSGQTMKKEREIQYLFIAPGRCTALGFPLVNLFQRYAICRELASALAFLAERRVVFGDINAKNALFSVGPERHEGSVMLVDCDAVRVTGTRSAVPQLSAPDWEPPPSERHSLTHDTDVYKFALFVIRCLSPGPNASTARSPQRVEKLLDRRGMDLLDASLSEDKRRRPRIFEWVTYFTELSQTGPAKVHQAALTTTPNPPRKGWVKENGSWVRAD